MKNKPGPKIKSFSERTHQMTFSTKGYNLEKFESKESMLKWLNERLRLYQPK